MMRNYYIFFALFIALFLTACKKELTYSYLMEHPQALQQEMNNCQNSSEKTSRMAAQCDIVLKAATDFQALITAMQQDPEKFGQIILNEETSYAKTKDALQKAREEVETGKNSTTEQALAAQAKLNEAEKAYQDQREKVKILLAVAGIGSPE